MLDRILRYFVWESRAITGAPVTFGAAVLAMAALISCGVIWAFRQETISLRQQLAEYRQKLGGASPDQAKDALDVLTGEVTALQARLKPRRVSAPQQRTISDRLQVPAGAQYALAIVQEGGCWDCPQYAADFEGAFRGAVGWSVSHRVIMGLPRRPAHGLAVVVLDPAHPSAQESLLFQALHAAGIEFDVEGALSPLDKQPQLLLAARVPE
jgi:hypothetical protein